MTNEQELFFRLTNFTAPDKKRIEDLLSENASASLLGNLFFNRLSGLAYGVLKALGLLGSVNREFRNSLGAAYEQNIQKNESFFQCVETAMRILNLTNKPYVLLKGSVLCREYPRGYRTANDIDILINVADIGAFSDVLIKNGFKQGNIRNGEFVPATRKEIIESKMTRGETVPFIIEVNLPQMKYLEIDINFSLDYKNGDISVVQELLEHRVLKNLDGMEIQTLNNVDFFIHLCCHLHKEATTLPWITMNRDMTLYKYVDIMYVIKGMSEEETKQFISRAQELQLEKVCACVTLWINDFWEIDNDILIEWAKKIMFSDPEMLLRVIDPKNKTMFLYENHDIRERFFEKNRKALLKEITDEKT